MTYYRLIALLLLLSYGNSLIPSQRYPLARSWDSKNSRSNLITCTSASSSSSSLYLTEINWQEPASYSKNLFLQLIKRGNGASNDLIKRFRSIFSPRRSREVVQPFKTNPSPLLRIVPLCFLSLILSLVSYRPALVRASVGVLSEAPATTNISPLQGLAIWGGLFTLSAILHSAESAITKLSTWKIQEFAEEEGPTSPFATLSTNITKLLITILLTTTACSIYSTALFVTSISRLFPKLSLGLVTAALTVITLFFGELLPKALAVSNSEYVARKLVPLISPYSMLLSPLTSIVTILSDLILRMFGMRSEEDRNVSEDMLRLVVDEAQRSDEGIETGEGRMIKNVLDMQDKEVERIMQPRVEIVAVPETFTASELLKLAVVTKYSRIPVYRTDIDHIVGIIYSKDLLDFIRLPTSSTITEDDETTTNNQHTASSTSSPTNTSPSSSKKVSSSPPTSNMKQLLPKLADSWNDLTAKDLMEKPYFIPETMSCWNALQEMRRRRVHIAIVVDEYGGTSGLVTFEDILEEVVGEIYDEDDDREEQVDDWTIFRYSDGKTFKMKAYAELDDVFEALGIDPREKEKKEEIGEYSTIGGLLCSIAGRIPQEGDEIVFANYVFFIEKVEDNRRLVDIKVSPIVSSSLPTVSGEGIANGVGAVDESNSFETESYASDSERSSEELVEVTSSDSGDISPSPDRVDEISSYRGPGSRGGGGDDSNDSSDRERRNDVADISTMEGSKVDGKTSKTLIFLDGEWIDPNSILEEEK